MSRRALLVSLAMLLSACAGLPVHTPRTAAMATTAITDYADTPLKALTTTGSPGDGRSGFRLQPFGPNAFATRIELARLATRSLDVQYYLLQGDNTGRTLMRALRDAAARGVRVRVLIDDLYTAGEDELLLALDSYPNVQVRLFNPFPACRDNLLTRFVCALPHFDRLNRRMHNKLFIADNVAAVAGGRNMADEYVMNAQGSNFVDMDVFAVGPVVHELSNAFDHYWNSTETFRIQDVTHTPLTPPQLQQYFERTVAGATPPEASFVRPDGRVEGSVDDGAPIIVPPDLVPMMNLPFELARHRLGPLTWAHARVLFDPLSKTAGLNEREDSVQGTVTGGVIAWFGTARSDLWMVSPYFVPSDAAVAAIVKAREAGIAVEVATNSLASTDEPAVYAGYEPRVKALLKAGVTIYELSPSLSVKRRKLGLFGAKRRGALHMKSAIVDHRQVFLGSMNLDRRSALLNTELGLIIDSKTMAQRLKAMADTGSAYRLRLSADGQDVQWVEDDGHDPAQVYDVPPETTGWLRFKLWLLAPFIPEGQL